MSLQGASMISSGIGGRDPFEERTLLRLTAHDDRIFFTEKSFLAIKPHIRLTAAGVRSVAMETDVGQDRPDVTIELHNVVSRRNP